MILKHLRTVKKKCGFKTDDDLDWIRAQKEELKAKKSLEIEDKNGVNIKRTLSFFGCEAKVLIDREEYY